VADHELRLHADGESADIAAGRSGTGVELFVVTDELNDVSAGGGVVVVVGEDGPGRPALSVVVEEALADGDELRFGGGAAAESEHQERVVGSEHCRLVAGLELFDPGPVELVVGHSDCASKFGRIADPVEAVFPAEEAGPVEFQQFSEQALLSATAVGCSSQKPLSLLSHPLPRQRARQRLQGGADVHGRKDERA